MELQIRILVGLLSIMLEVCSTIIYCESCGDLKWDEYILNPKKSEYIKGGILLAKDKNGVVFNELNLLIINTSENILTENKDSVKSKHYFNNLFIKNTFKSIDSTKEFNIKTSIQFCSLDILTYQVIFKSHNIRDVGSPYYEYININLSNKQVISFDDVIENQKNKDFNIFFKSYFMNHRDEIIKNYKQIQSEKADQFLIEEQEVFLRKDYSLEKLNINLNEIQLLAFKNNGIEWGIEVLDKNFSNNNHSYQSSILISYRDLLPFYNKKSNIYSSLVKFSK